MGSEIIDPQKNMPKVIIISTVTVGIMYALVAMVASGVLPLEVVSNQNLSLVAADVMPGWAFTYFTLAAGAGATAKTLNVTLSWSPKPILIACDDGMLPRSWGTVSKRGVPYKILAAFFFIGLIPLLAGMDISLISKMGTAISLLSKLMFSYAFLNLPKKYPEAFARSEMKVSERYRQDPGLRQHNPVRDLLGIAHHRAAYRCQDRLRYPVCRLHRLGELRQAG